MKTQVVEPDLTCLFSESLDMLEDQIDRWIAEQGSKDEG
jgi:hypothetical protein